MALKDWSQTAASNTSIDTISIAENCPFANMNDAVRAVMKNVRDEVASQGTDVTAAALATISGASQFKLLTGGTTITAFDTAVTGLYREMLASTTLILAPTTALGLSHFSGNISLEPGALVRARSLGAGNWVAFPQRSNGEPVTRFYEEGQAVTVTAATIVDVSAAIPFAPLSGNTTIEGLSTAVTGAYRELRVLGTPLLKHNGTSNIVPGGASVTLAANDLLRSRSLGAGNWAHKVDRASGLPLVGPTAYVEGTFTPVLKFGGASVGIAYGTQGGRYTRIGNRVFFVLSIILTNVGSSTGAATITGLPIASAATNFSPVQMTGNGNMASLTVPFGTIDGGVTVIDLRQQTATGVSAPTQANFTNTSSITLAGFYEVS